jgi:hypothetical protein
MEENVVLTDWATSVRNISEAATITVKAAQRAGRRAPLFPLAILE